MAATNAVAVMPLVIDFRFMIGFPFRACPLGGRSGANATRRLIATLGMASCAWCRAQALLDVGAFLPPCQPARVTVRKDLAPSGGDLARIWALSHALCAAL
jgi:hypothetical protein